MSSRIISFAAPSATELERLPTEVGWLLATAGHRVLIINGRAPALTPPLRPFATMSLPDLEEEDRWALAPLAGPALIRYLLPDAHVMDMLMPDQPHNGKLDPAGVRTVLDRLGYEYALVCAPPERWSSDADRLAGVSDLVVLGLSGASASIEAVGVLAGQIRGLAPQPEIVSVVNYSAIDDEVSRSRLRGKVQRTLTPPGDPAQAPRVIELHDRPYPGRQPVLAPLVTEGMASYHELLGAVTAGAVREAPEAPSKLRHRYRRRIERRTDVDPEWILVAYPRAVRGWAEWIVSELCRAGARARLLPAADDRDGGDGGDGGEGATAFVVIGSMDQLAPEDRENLSTRLDRAGPDPEVLQVRVPETGPTGDLPYRAGLLDLTTTAAPEAGARLLAPFMLTPSTDAGATGDRRWRPQFPGGRQEQLAGEAAPPPNPDFVGREDELVLLREGLIDGNTMVVTGPAAAGTTEVARAYVHRYGFDYDLVWWVPAHDRPSIRNSVNRLAAEVGEATRWLLVFDDADDPASLPPLPPLRGVGHVVITAREYTDAGAVHISATLDPSAAVALYARDHPGLSYDDARRLVERLGGEPPALRLAAAALRERRAQGMTGAGLSEQAVQSYLDSLPDPAAGGTASAVRANLALMAGAGETGVLALWLARMCVFVSPNGVSLNLLHTLSMIEALATLAPPAARAQLTNDSAVLDAVIWLGTRHGLFDVDWGHGNVLRIHRVIQQEIAAATPVDALSRARRAVLAGFAGAVPSSAEVEITANRARLDELRPHLLPSGALTDNRRAVRRWVVIQTQYAARYGDAEECGDVLALAEAISNRWQQHAGGEADLRLRLDAERAQLHARLGQYRPAASIQLEVRDDLRQLLGLEHVRTLLASRSAARYLRRLGRFTEAQHEDHVSHEGFLHHFGGAHPNTVRAADSLAFDTFLVGDIEAAEQLQRDLVHRLAGQTQWDRDTPWLYASNLGMYLRELGRYQEAWDSLQQALARVGSGSSTEALSRVALRIRRNMAVIRRWQGRPGVARDDDNEIVDECLARYGPDDPDTLAVQLALAADHLALGAADEALGLGSAARDGFRRTLLPRYGIRPDDPGTTHPYVYLYELALGAFQLAADRTQQALATSALARHGLAAALGDRHPWALAAEANRLAVLAVTGPVETVAGQLDALLADCEEYLPAAHPYGRVVEQNLELLRVRRPLRPIIVDIPWF